MGGAFTNIKKKPCGGGGGDLTREKKKMEKDYDRKKPVCRGANQTEKTRTSGPGNGRNPRGEKERVGAKGFPEWLGRKTIAQRGFRRGGKKERGGGAFGGEGSRKRVTRKRCAP